MQEDETRPLPVTRQRASPGPADVTEAVGELVRVAFGVVALALGVALRTVDPPAAAPGPVTARASVIEVTDLAVGAAWGAANLTGRLARTGGRVAAPVVAVVLRPPLVPRRLQPGEGLARMTEQWRRDRPDTVRSLGAWSSTMLPRVIQTALRQVDVQVSVDAVLDAVDVDAVVADVVRRIDVDVVLDAVDVDAVVAGVIRRMDVDATVALLLARLDLAAASAAALDQLDLTQLVIDRVDVERVVSGVLDRMDLTALAVDQIDLGRIVDAALAQVDLTQVVVDQVDLIGVAEYVVAGIDLPEIIRSSSTSVVSDTVRGLRMQGVGADQAVTRAVDRVLFRRAHRRAAADNAMRQASRAPDARDLP